MTVAVEATTHLMPRQLAIAQTTCFLATVVLWPSAYKPEASNVAWLNTAAHDAFHLVQLLMRTDQDAALRYGSTFALLVLVGGRCCCCYPCLKFQLALWRTLALVAESKQHSVKCKLPLRGQPSTYVSV